MDACFFFFFFFTKFLICATLLFPCSDIAIIVNEAIYNPSLPLFVSHSSSASLFSTSQLAVTPPRPVPAAHTAPSLFFALAWMKYKLGSLKRTEDEATRGCGRQSAPEGGCGCASP